VQQHGLSCNTHFDVVRYATTSRKKENRLEKYTKSQEAAVQKFAIQLYEVGFLADTGLAKSSCGCCHAKRDLLVDVQRALARTKRK
jgi:hypothetical protein